MKNMNKNITRYGNEIISKLKDNFFHKPRKEQYSTISAFEVIIPTNELETVGERLELSMFGEYCPKESLRGYSLEELILKPHNYRPKEIIQMGERILINHNI